MTFLTDDEKTDFHNSSVDMLERCLAWFPYIGCEESQYIERLIRDGMQIAIIPPKSGGVEVWAVIR